MTSSVYSAGTVSVSNGSAVVIGTGTAWAVALVKGGMFSFAGSSIPIASVESDTSLTLAYPWPGTTAAGGYAIARETSEAVRAAWINDRLAQILTKLSLAGVHPDGAGTLAERNALSPQPPAGYLWLRVETGFDLVFYKRTASGWDGPFGLKGDDGQTGPSGVLNWIEAGWATATNYAFNAGLTHAGTSYRCYVAHTSSAATEPGTGANWQTVWKVTAARGSDGVSFISRGDYSGVTAYAADDVVLNAGSSWLAKQATTGNAPPNLPTTENTWWRLMAAKGTDGSGTGDMQRATYDPTNKVADAFAMDNMADGASKVAMTAAERSKLAGIAAGATVTNAAAVGAAIAGTSQVPVPADGDRFSGVLAGGSTLFWTTFGNIKASLKTYFDGFYAVATRTISAGTGLTGGGDLSANRSFAIDKATAAQVRAATADKVVTPDGVLGAMGWVAITAGAAPAIDHAAGVNRTITHTANATMGAPSNPKPGWPLNIDITPGAFTTSWAAAYKFGATGAPSITARRIVHFTCDLAGAFVFLGMSDPS